MAHFAKVVGGTVVQVIVAEPEFFETYIDTSPGVWIQSSYNTCGGVNLAGGTPLRKNFAGVGMVYDVVRDAFIPPKPFPSWKLNEHTCIWEAPVVRPSDNRRYTWDENALMWVALPVGVDH